MASTNKTTNYSLSQFLAADVPSWISDYTADMQKIEEGMTDNKAGVKSVQPDEYSDASTYSVGDYCIENNTIYKCKTAINSPEEFNPSHWEETTIYKELSAVNSSLGGWSRIVSKSVIADNTYEVDLPENKALLATVENTYGVGCLYFVQTASSSENRDASVYSLAGNPNYFKIESISGQAAKVKVSPGGASGTLRVYRF